MRDAMLDLETMGKGPNAAISAIGAVLFDIDSRTIGTRFYRVVDLESSVNAGGVMDVSTVRWWMNQSEKARAMYEVNGVHIIDALIEFERFMGEAGKVDDRRVWGNGAAFDNVILASAYERSGFVKPWSYKGDMCYRTIRGLFPAVQMQPTGTHHNALDDAVNQAVHLIQILNPGEITA